MEARTGRELRNAAEWTSQHFVITPNSKVRREVRVGRPRPDDFNDTAKYPRTWLKRDSVPLNHHFFPLQSILCLKTKIPILKRGLRPQGCGQ